MTERELITYVRDRLDELPDVVDRAIERSERHTREWAEAVMDGKIALCVNKQHVRDEQRENSQVVHLPHVYNEKPRAQFDWVKFAKTCGYIAAGAAGVVGGIMAAL